jgi:hypothetical protein
MVMEIAICALMDFRGWAQIATALLVYIHIVLLSTEMFALFVFQVHTLVTVAV